MNNGLSENLKGEFPLHEPYPRPLIYNLDIPHAQWVSGFVSGDGFFYVLIRQTTAKAENFRVVLRFVISQHQRDNELMAKFINYFNCGHLEKYDDMEDFWVNTNGDNMEKIIPFFIKNKILGIKAKDFED